MREQERLSHKASLFFGQSCANENYQKSSGRITSTPSSIKERRQVKSEGAAIYFATYVPVVQREHGNAKHSCTKIVSGGRPTMLCISSARLERAPSLLSDFISEVLNKFSGCCKEEET